MAGPNEDLIIEIPSDAIPIAGALDPDGLPKVVAEEVDEPAPKPKAKDPEPRPDLELQRQLEESNRRIAEMAKTLDGEKAARVAAEVDRDKSTDTAWRTHWAKVNSDHESLKGHIAATDSEMSNAERELQAATTDNDAARIATATRSLARLEALKARLEEGRAGAEEEIAKTKTNYAKWVEDQKAAKPEPKAEPKPEPTKKTTEVLTPDEWIETQAPRATRSWFREHPEFVKPGTKQQRQLDVFVAKYLLDNDRDPHDIGYLNTSAFVQALDKEFFPSEDVHMADDDAPKRGAREEEPEAKVAAKQRVTTPAAPVSRSGNYFSSSNMTAKQVRLPPKLAKFVKDSGLDPTQYALGAVEDIKAGKLPKNFLDPDYDHNF